MARSCSLLIALALAACGTSAESPPPSGASTSPEELLPPPPPAPLPATSYEDVLSMLRAPHPERCMPFFLSNLDPLGEIRVGPDGWTLHRVVLDAAAANAAARRALAAGEPWMPESSYRFQHLGPPIAQGATAAELADAIERLPRDVHLLPEGAQRDLCPQANDD